MEVLQNLELELLYCQVILVMCIHSKELKTIVQKICKDNYVCLLTVAWFITAKRWNQPLWLSAPMNEKKFGTHDGVTAIKKCAVFRLKVDNIVIIEISQPHKQSISCFLISGIWVGRASMKETEELIRIKRKCVEKRVAMCSKNILCEYTLKFRSFVQLIHTT